jgi:hypothetical protein
MMCKRAVHRVSTNSLPPSRGKGWGWGGERRSTLNFTQDIKRGSHDARESPLIQVRVPGSKRRIQLPLSRQPATPIRVGRRRTDPASGGPVARLGAIARDSVPGVRNARWSRHSPRTSAGGFRSDPGTRASVCISTLLVGATRRSNPPTPALPPQGGEGETKNYVDNVLTCVSFCQEPRP